MRKNQAEVDAVPIGRAADEPEFQEPKLFNGDHVYPGKLVFAVNPVCYVSGPATSISPSDASPPRNPGRYVARSLAPAPD